MKMIDEIGCDFVDMGLIHGTDSYLSVFRKDGILFFNATERLEDDGFAQKRLESDGKFLESLK